MAAGVQKAPRHEVAGGWVPAGQRALFSLPDGGELRTLLDAARYVDALPRSTHEREVLQTVMEVLLAAVEGREPVRLVQVALTLALQESKPMRGARRKPHES